MGGRGNMNARSGKYHGKGGKGTNRNGQGEPKEDDEFDDNENMIF